MGSLNPRSNPDPPTQSLYNLCKPCPDTPDVNGLVLLVRLIAELHGEDFIINNVCKLLHSYSIDINVSHVRPE